MPIERINITAWEDANGILPEYTLLNMTASAGSNLKNPLYKPPNRPTLVKLQVLRLHELAAHVDGDFPMAGLYSGLPSVKDVHECVFEWCVQSFDQLSVNYTSSVLLEPQQSWRLYVEGGFSTGVYGSPYDNSQRDGDDYVAFSVMNDTGMLRFHPNGDQDVLYSRLNLEL